MAPWTRSSGAGPRNKTAELPEGRGNKMSLSPDCIIWEGPRWVWAATSDWIIRGGKRIAPGWVSKNGRRRRGQNRRLAAQQRKQEQDHEELRANRGETDSTVSSLGNWGQDQAQSDNISEEGDQDTRVGNGDKRATRSRSAGQGTKKKAHCMRRQPEESAKRPRLEQRG